MTRSRRHYHNVPLRANRFVLTTTSDTLGGKKCSSHMRAIDANRLMLSDVETGPAIFRSSLHSRHKMAALILVGALIILGCMIFWQQAVTPWWQGIQDQWDYGNAHISQFDANVGHGGVSRFLAEYYQGAITVIEIPELNPANTHIYTLTGMLGGSNDTVILLSTQQGKLPNKPDLLIQVKGSGFTITLYNTGQAFQQNEEQ